MFSYSIPAHICNLYPRAGPYRDSGNIPPAQADGKQSQATEGLNAINLAGLLCKRIKLERDEQNKWRLAGKIKSEMQFKNRH